MLNSPKAEHPAVPTGKPDVEEMVAQYHHQLLCLEADLKDRARLGLMRPREYAKRVSRLKTVQKELDVLRKYAIAEHPGHLSDTDIGLPVLDNCTPTERDTCERGMLEKEYELLRIEQDVSKAQKWLRDAISGKSGSLMLTFRLSKLRRLIHTYSKLLTHAENEQDQIEQAGNELAKSLKVKKTDAKANITLQTLMDLFVDLEKTISRVAQLRVSVRRETIKVGEMNAWLKQEETRFSRGLTIRKPPTPLTMAGSSFRDTSAHSGLTKKSIERRQLVEHFWREVINQREVFSQRQESSPMIDKFSKNTLPEQQHESVVQLQANLPHPSRRVRKKSVKNGGRK